MTGTPHLPVVALTLGDPAGIGPELIAKLLARPDATSRANIVLIGDPWLWQEGQRVAGVQVKVDPIASLADARLRSSTGRPAFVAIDTVEQILPRAPAVPAPPRPSRLVCRAQGATPPSPGLGARTPPAPAATRQ